MSDVRDGTPALDAQLEPRALAAWPPEEREQRGGWVLRATGGVTRRANSVWAGRATGDASLAARIDAAERWYAARGLPPLFQLPPSTAPGGLDEALAARGYRREAPVVVMAAPELLAAPGSARAEGASSVSAPEEAPVSIALAEAPGDAWLDLATAARAFDRGQRALYRGIVARVPRPAAFALARRADGGAAGSGRGGGADAEPVGCGLAVVQGPWLFVAAMATAPSARRRGVARAVLRALVAFGARHGARGVWLQVEEGNAAARALYEGAGLRPAYRLHYRRAAEDPAGGG